jgi:hypothetical protein
MTVLYRYENWQTAPLWDDYEFSRSPSTTHIGLRDFQIVRTTPKGAWINYGGTERFVKLDARKRFACPTKEEALQSFIARKEKQKRILNEQIRQTDNALRLANKELDFLKPLIYT